MKSREEISNKIEELEKAAASVDSAPKKDFMLLEIAIVGFGVLATIVGGAVDHNSGFHFLIYFFIFLPLLIFAGIINYRRGRRIAEKRRRLAEWLREALTILDKPDSDKLFYKTLDEFIIHRNRLRKERRKFIGKDPEVYEAEIAVEAFTWITT